MIVLVKFTQFLLTFCPLHIVVTDEEDILIISYDYELAYYSLAAGLSFDKQLLNNDMETSY